MGDQLPTQWAVRNLRVVVVVLKTFVYIFYIDLQKKSTPEQPIGKLRACRNPPRIRFNCLHRTLLERLPDLSTASVKSDWSPENLEEIDQSSCTCRNEP